MVRRRALPRVEELDGRCVPSVVPLTPSAASAPMQPSVQHALAGRGTGTYTSDTIMSDVGATYHLHGTGSFAGLGQVKIEGNVRTPGFIANGIPTGTLTLAGKHGSVKVQLTGMGPAGAGSTMWFHYQIVGGSHHDKHVTDQGTLRLDLKAAPPPARHGPAAPSGTFTLLV